VRIRAMRRILTALVIVAALAGGLYLLRARLVSLLPQDALFRYAVRNLSEEQKREFYARLAASTPSGIWEAVPEPAVGRVLQFNIRKTDMRAEVVTNAAGMRSGRPYGPKGKDRFRIVCLGDSMVMGTAGKEEDRWSDQMEQALARAGATVDGKAIEVLSLGNGGWTSLNEAAYLSQRLSSYQPDLVLALMVDNDLNDAGGVLGIGQGTYTFTTEHRDLGSSVFVDHLPLQFGLGDKNLLAAGLGPESEGRWTEAFAAWKRLETLLDQTGGRMVFGVLRAADLFVEQARHHHARAGLRSPLIVTEYFGQRLPHDPHPNREGNGTLAGHYLHVLAKLGWLPVAASALPPLHAGLSADALGPPDAARVAALQREAAAALREGLEFDRLEKADVRALLGGVYPGEEGRPLASFPFGTLKSAFLLRARPGATRVRVEVEVPPFVELYPFALEMRLDGEPVATLRLAGRTEAGRHVLTGAIPARAQPPVALEVGLRTASYWTGVTDFTMRSYRLVSARQE
jgi:hypothetical protein